MNQLKVVKPQSQQELVSLHALLNNELTKLNQEFINESNCSYMDTLHSIQNRIRIMKAIQQINKQIQDIATVRKAKKVISSTFIA